MPVPALEMVEEEKPDPAENCPIGEVFHIPAVFMDSRFPRANGVRWMKAGFILVCHSQAISRRENESIRSVTAEHHPACFSINENDPREIPKYSFLKEQT